MLLAMSSSASSSSRVFDVCSAKPWLMSCVLLVSENRMGPGPGPGGKVGPGPGPGPGPGGEVGPGPGPRPGGEVGPGPGLAALHPSPPSVTPSV